MPIQATWMLEGMGRTPSTIEGLESDNPGPGLTNDTLSSKPRKAKKQHRVEERTYTGHRKPTPPGAASKLIRQQFEALTIKDHCPRESEFINARGGGWQTAGGLVDTSTVI